MEKYIPWIISALALLISFLTYNRNGDKDERQERANEDAKFDNLKEAVLKISLSVDQIASTTNETRTDIKSLNKDLQQITERVAILERDVKTVFSRIDELKGEMNHD